MNIPTLTRAEFYVLHEHLSSTLAGAPEDPGSVYLRGVLRKMRSIAGRLICQTCGVASVHAQGRCEACYRYWRRNGSDREVTFGVAR